MKRRILAFFVVLMVIGGSMGCGKTNKSSPAENEAGAQDADISNAGNANGTRTGSQESGDGDAKGSQPKYVQPEMKGEITISTMYEMEFLTKAANDFMEKYPDITVKVHTALELSDNDTNGNGKIEDYRTGLNTKIMSGKAEDIIFTQQLPVKKYMDMGVFEDLSMYLEASPEINEQNYFMNVLEAARDKDKHLFVLPYKTSFDVISFEEKLLSGEDYFQDKGSLRFSEAAEYAKKKMDAAKLDHTYLTLQGNSGYMYALVREYLNHMVDLDSKKVDINNSQYVGWLKEVKKLDEDGYFDPPGLNFYNTKYYFAMNSDYDVQSAFYNLYPGGDCQGKPVADADGNVYTSGSDCVGINSASKNKGIAWEFIKYLLSAEIQSQPSFSIVGTAVNKEGFAISAERCLKFYTDGTNENVRLEDYKALLESWVAQINRCDFSDPTITNYFGEEQDKFFKGKQSAEQTAQNLQNKITQYLKE